MPKKIGACRIHVRVLHTCTWLFRRLTAYITPDNTNPVGQADDFHDFFFFKLEKGTRSWGPRTLRWGGSRPETLEAELPLRRQDNYRLH